MNLDADIVPGRSIGGIVLGQEALGLIERLQQRHRVSARPALNPDYTCYDIDEAMTIVVGNRDFVVANLAARRGYRGRLFGYIHAGMRVHELIAGAPSALLKAIHPHNEFVYLDRAESVGFLLPPQYDDAADRIEHLPPELVLDTLYVMPAAMRQVPGRDGKPSWRPID
ncbi:MAG: hypothetical protein JF591_10230 [Lysobacter sp.]|nr:hypothetical protein [Lysobacter sp.]